MPFLRQARALVSRPELRGLVADLRPVVPNLARLTNASVPLYTHGMLERLLRARLESPEKRPAGTVWLRHLEDSQNHATLDQVYSTDPTIGAMIAHMMK